MPARCLRRGRLFWHKRHLTLGNRVIRVDLPLPEVYRRRLCRLVRHHLLQFLPPYSSVSPGTAPSKKGRRTSHRVGTGRHRTKFSYTHLLSFHSAGRHCHSCWLLLSRHCQCARNCPRQDLLMSSILYPGRRWVSMLSRFSVRTSSQFCRLQPLVPAPLDHSSGEKFTHTLRAHRVTLRPSERHAISPVPGFSVLHCM